MVHWHTDLYNELSEEKRLDTSSYSNYTVKNFRQKHVFSVLNHTVQHRLNKVGAWKAFRVLLLVKQGALHQFPYEKKNHSWYSKINWMRLCRSIASFIKITLNNYRITLRMRSLIGVAEIILEKSITIQISIFQSHSLVSQTLQTLKALSLATGEGSNESLGGSHSRSFNLVGQAWESPQRFCSLCAVSLSTRKQGFVLQILHSLSSPLHDRQEKSHGAQPRQTGPALGPITTLFLQSPCHFHHRYPITWLSLIPVKHFYKRGVGHMRKCPLSWFLSQHFYCY